MPEAVVDPVFATDVQPNWASFPKTHTEAAYSATVVITRDLSSEKRELPFLAATYPMVQTLPGGDTLVVAPRCAHFKDGTHELKARRWMHGRLHCMVHEKLLSQTLPFLVFDGYRENRTDCSLYKLLRGEAEKVSDVTLRLPHDVDLNKAEVIGRGALLYVVADSRVFKFVVPF